MKIPVLLLLCAACAFAEVHTMTLEQVWEVAGKGYSEAVSEFHIVGGLHPELTLDVAGLRSEEAIATMVAMIAAACETIDSVFTSVFRGCFGFFMC
mgnify:CR=1 FL=1